MENVRQEREIKLEFHLGDKEESFESGPERGEGARHWAT